MNQKFSYGYFAKLLLASVAAAILFSVGPAAAVEINRQGEALLLDSYRRNMARLETNSFGIPLVVEFFERDNRVHVDVYGIFDFPFASGQEALTGRRL